MLRLRLVLAKCPGIVRTNLNLRLRLAFAKFALHIPASLNSNCVFDLFSLSVQVSFALTSTCAFGLLSLSALHKKSGHTHAILCLPRRSALLYSHAPCRCPYTDHSASVSRMSKFIIRDLSQNCKLHFSKWT